MPHVDLSAGCTRFDRAATHASRAERKRRGAIDPIGHSITYRIALSDSHVTQGRIQPFQVIDVGGQHTVPVFSRAQDDRRVYDVASTCDSAKLARRARAFVVERHDLDEVRAEQASEPHLAAAVAPSLTHHAGRRGKANAVLLRARDDGDHDPIVALERNQSARIQREPVAHLRRRL
jgi:hypothetical protein